jgi:Na+/glutamate symporter
VRMDSRFRAPSLRCACACATFGSVVDSPVLCGGIGVRKLLRKDEVAKSMVEEVKYRGKVRSPVCF